MLDFEFSVEQTSDHAWTITVCPPFGESIKLPGAFITRHAAFAALARNRSRWTEDPSGHGLRMIDGGQAAPARAIRVRDQPGSSGEKSG